MVMVMWFAWVIWGEFFPKKKNSRRPHRDPQKFIFSYKKVSGRNGDHEWLRMANTFILCDLVWTVQKSQAVNREGSFKHWTFTRFNRMHYSTEKYTTFCLPNMPIDANKRGWEVGILIYFPVLASYHTHIVKLSQCATSGVWHIVRVSCL